MEFVLTATHAYIRVDLMALAALVAAVASYKSHLQRGPSRSDVTDSSPTRRRCHRANPPLTRGTCRWQP